MGWESLTCAGCTKRESTEPAPGPPPSDARDAPATEVGDHIGASLVATRVMEPGHVSDDARARRPGAGLSSEVSALQRRPLRVPRHAASQGEEATPRSLGAPRCAKFCGARRVCRGVAARSRWEAERRNASGRQEGVSKRLVKTSPLLSCGTPLCGGSPLPLCSRSALEREPQHGTSR